MKKLNSNQLYPVQKLTLYLILPVAEVLGQYINQQKAVGEMGTRLKHCIQRIAKTRKVTLIKNEYLTCFCEVINSLILKRILKLSFFISP